MSYNTERKKGAYMPNNRQIQWTLLQFSKDFSQSQTSNKAMTKNEKLEAIVKWPLAEVQIPGRVHIREYDEEQMDIR